MKEYMFLIRNYGSSKMALPEEEHRAFLQQCEDYIGELIQQNRLLSAQPLIRQGIVVSGKPGAWAVENIQPEAEMQVGYYHILADSLEEAVEIAKRNPEFAYGSTARIEVRPVKMKEESTGYQYPTKG